MKHRRRNRKRKQFKERHRLTKADCQRGYKAALQKCMEDWGLYAWFFHRIRGHYRKKGA